MFAGIDIGSVTTKAVILSQDQEILAFSMIPTISDRNKSGEDVLELVLGKIRGARSSLKYIVSTGYGRRSFTFSDDVSPEIICHAEGTKFLFLGFGQL